jgi:hypothetical protein
MRDGNNGSEVPNSAYASAGEMLNSLAGELDVEVTLQALS